jgi:elongation of very long chain fatty acids protein 6
MDQLLETQFPELRNFTTHAAFRAVNANGYTAPAVAVTVYLLAVFVLIPAVRPKQAGGIWKHLFALWNLALSAFSTVGVLVCVPFVYRKWQEHGLRWLLCSDALMWGPPADDASCSGSIGLMMTLFMLSKFPELLDTFFLVYMRKPVAFLHWYHHATVLLYSWFAYKNATPSAVFFATMNYCVHAVMYFYFAASTYTRALSFLRLPITSLQLGQMVMGVALTVAAYEYSNRDGGCSPSYAESHFFEFCGALYGSYFVLFAHLFYKSYVSGTGKKKATTTGKPKSQ